MAVDQDRCRFLQKAVEEGNRRDVDFLLSCSYINCCYRTRIVQKLITTLRTKEQIASIVDAFQPVFLELVNDINVNHVIKRCLERFNIDDNKKFSSHVVEKCIKDLEESRPVLVRDILSVPRFGQLLQDPYANCVILSALTHTKGQIRAVLVSTIMHGFLRTSPYCKKIFRIGC